MRYVILLLILCVSFFALNSVTQYRTPFSFLSTGKAAPTGAYSAGKHARIHWATASMMPLKGGPSAGMGLPRTGNGSTEALAAIGTASSVGIAAPAVAAAPAHFTSSTTNPTHIQQVVQLPVYRSGASVTDASAPGSGANTVAVSGTNTVADAAIQAPTPTSAQVTDRTGADVAGAGNASVAEAAALESDISLSADYLDMDLAAIPDAVGTQPSEAAFALSREANAFALKIADSIRNSLMDPHGIQFGGIAGLNWSGAAASSSTAGKVSGTPLTGFTLGMFADIPVQKHLSFRPSLVYAYEGYQPNVNGDKVDIHTAFLKAPLDLVYHTNLFNKRFYIGAGPYAAYGLGGTYTLKGIATDMVFGNNYAAGDNLRRIDFGGNIMAGILMDRNFMIGATFDLGLNNLAPSGSATTIHTRSVGLSIGYVFRNRHNTPISTSAY
jgi:hypothetical protein